MPFITRHYRLQAHERLFEYRSALDNFSKAVERGGEYLEPHYRIYSTAQKCLFDNILSPSEIAGFLGGTFEAETDWHSVEEKLRGKLECILEVRFKAMAPLGTSDKIHMVENLFLAGLPLLS